MMWPTSSSLWNAITSDDRGDRPDRGEDVGDDVVLEVDQRDRDEQQDHDDRQPDVLVGAEAQHAGGAQHAGDGLDDRVLRRDVRPARAAAPAQPQPPEHRDVVVGLDRRAARGTRRRRVQQRLAARQPVGHHVEEGADDRSEDRGYRGRHTDAHRACSVADMVRMMRRPCYGRSATARPAATVRRPASRSSGPGMTRASSGRRSALAEALDEAGDGDGGAGDEAQLDRLGAVLGAVEVQRGADVVGELAHAVLERGARGGDQLGVAVDAVQRRGEADVRQPRARVLERERATLGERRSRSPRRRRRTRA